MIAFDPIPLPRGRQLITLEDAGGTPESRARGRGVAGGDGSPDPGRGTGRAGNVCQDRHHAGAKIVMSSACSIPTAKIIVGDGGNWRGIDEIATINVCGTICRPYALTGCAARRGANDPENGLGVLPTRGHFRFAVRPWIAYFSL
ncbi:hypothetical protein SAMN05444159_2057 [Bradyrhizobium lablabi]|uniref:Uncharacterized protein n=1 Tax=Bradyrhizobium lablabi TaxID=722472 RepID=A0A1M6NP76_9BRAD|nr:hypothetical protein [Bradyrhizobium lablabi]SHJ97426.1 hypothetical protein SAMN05444159_2057 [Bradyrhizobium lablabi]